MPSGENKNLDVAAFGAGCFWHVEEAFIHLKGVKSTAVGFMGGADANPTYDEVCTGRTGHAEVVEITYDPEVISYQELLKIFWENHDPTQLNRQGPDAGAQYRSVIFFHTPEQEVLARKSKEELERSGRFKNKIVTEIVPASSFYRAEEYHQQYEHTHGRTCRV